MNEYTVEQGSMSTISWEYDNAANPKCDNFMICIFPPGTTGAVRPGGTAFVGGASTRSFSGQIFFNQGVMEVGIMAFNTFDRSIDSEVPMSERVLVKVVPAGAVDPPPNPTIRLGFPTGVKIS